MRRALLLPLLLLVTACAHFPVNDPLPPPYPARLGYRFENLHASVANTDSVLVVVSLSGGGTRAGAMAYGALRALDGIRISGGRSFLDELDILSAASGGSFAAGYYGTFGARRFFDEFRERVLYQDVGMGTFWRAFLCPYQLVRICSPWFNRSDLAADLYESTIFGETVYSDVLRRGRPFVVLNATELAAGRRFEFTQDRFDQLGSSLARVRVARAVAASSAFPILLTPVAFRDYTAEGERYVHVVDGGVVDNLGLGYVLESFQRGVIREMIDAGRVRTLVFVVVNARNRPRDEFADSPQAPGALDVLTLGLGAAIDRRGDDQGRLLAELCANEGLRGEGAPAVHLVEVDLEDLPDPAQRERLLAVETTFGLDEETVDELVRASGELIARSPAFARVKAALINGR